MWFEMSKIVEASTILRYVIMLHLQQNESKQSDLEGEMEKCATVGGLESEPEECACGFLLEECENLKSVSGSWHEVEFARI